MTINNKYSHRVSSKRLTFSDAPDTEVIVKQKRHSFLFGCSEFSSVDYASGLLEGEQNTLAEARYDRLTDIFNYVTLPFYWGRFEPVRGEPVIEKTKKAAQFWHDKNITLKGHPLCWHTVCADWLMQYSNDEILRLQLERIRRDVSEFKGLVDSWDVINEAVIMPVFDKYDNGVTRICNEYGTHELCRMVFREARETSPDSTLLINDFNLSDKYAELIEKLLDDGVKIDALGLQTHMHQGYMGTEKTHEILERFSKFNLPLHFTETTLVSGEIMPPNIIDLNDYKNENWASTPAGLERQAAETCTHYETLFAHPLVQSVTWWSFSDGGWLGAPSGLITKDSQPKPAYTELFKRIKGEWWLSEEKHITNDKGEFTVTGCYGDYTATYKDKTIDFTI